MNCKVDVRGRDKKQEIALNEAFHMAFLDSSYLLFFQRQIN